MFFVDIQKRTTESKDQMATKIAMPKLSDTMEEGIILKWLKKEGESVKQGEIIAEVQTDKADMELEAYNTGILRKIFVPEGKGAAVGKPIAIIGAASEDISSLLVDTSAPSSGHGAPASTPGGSDGREVTTRCHSSSCLGRSWRWPRKSIAAGKSDCRSEQN